GCPWGPCRSRCSSGRWRRRRRRSEEHTSELQSLAYLVCRLLLEKKKKTAMDGVTEMISRAPEDQNTTRVLSPIEIAELIFAVSLFFFNDTATTEIYTLSLHDALPIFAAAVTVDEQESPLAWLARRRGR